MFFPLYQKNNPAIRVAPVMVGIKNNADVTSDLLNKPNDADPGEAYKTMVRAATEMIAANDVVMHIRAMR
jgi:hypothetical protein